MKKALRPTLFTLLLVTLMPLPGHAEESSHKYLEQTFDEIRQILNLNEDQEHKSRLLRSLFFSEVDLKEVSRQTLGGYWEVISEGMQAGFASIFGEFLAQRFISEISRIQNVQITFAPGEETSGKARVLGRMKKSDGSETVVQFVLNRSPQGDWKVSGAEVEGINFLANFRSQFRKIIRDSSFDSLLARIRNKFRENSEDKK